MSQGQLALLASNEIYRASEVGESWVNGTKDVEVGRRYVTWLESNPGQPFGSDLGSGLIRIRAIFRALDIPEERIAKLLLEH